MTLTLTDEASVGARGEMLGASSVTFSEELPFLLATIKRKSVNFLEMSLLFHGAIAINIV